MAGTVKESQIQRAIMDYLAAERIPAWRMNSGAMSGSHKGKKWFVRFGERGMADILAAPPMKCGMSMSPAGFGDLFTPMFLWIEVKGERGSQSDFQKDFEQYVRENGMFYVLARSVDDVAAWLKGNRIINAITSEAR